MLGAGGFAREVLDTIDIINKHTDEAIEPIGFVYDNGNEDAGKLIHGIPVLGELSHLKKVDLNEIRLVAAVGRPVWRRKMVEEAKKMGGQFISIIHPTVTLSKWAKIGNGAIMQRFCIVMPEVVIGDFFISNGFVGIGHDAVIGDYVQMNPHVVISGGTIIGNDVFIGVRATVLPVRIGDGAVIGACALVTKDVPPNVMAKGMPAKVYEMNEKTY
jgi:sugar O-acyltransferase (sialic acid O-acetyltransferase NeuD family)